MAITQEQASNMDLQELSSQLAPRGNQAAADRIAAGRAALDSGMTGAQARQAARGVSPTVTATDLTDAPETPPVTPPVEPSALDMRTVNAVSNQNQEIIRSQSENAQELDRRRQEYAALADEGTLADFFAAEQQRMGIPQNLQELQDLQLQLSDMDTDSRLTKSRIAAAPGQTMAQAGREINQEDRENAIRSAGLAARASVLQGNIETASALVNQAVNLAYQDRTLRNQNLINQINDLRGVVSGETEQLLRQEQRRYEQDQQKIQQIETSVASALSSGAATTGEIAKLTSPQTTDNERLALAQLISARGATELRTLQTRAAEMDLVMKAEQLARLREPTVATRDTSVVDVGGQKQLIDTQTGEVIATFGADVSTDEIKAAREANFVNTLDGLKNHPGMSKAVGVSIPFLPDVTRFTPFKSDVLSGDVAEFTGSMQNVVKQLTLNTFSEAKAKGMTFGAMSQGEWDILGESATKIAQWQRETEDGYIYYDTSEKNIKKELDVLSNFAKMDALRKGAAPSDIGVMQQEDGTYWTRQHDGSYMQLEITPR